MVFQQKTLDLISAAHQVLQEYNPMTLRQVYYQLVSRHVIDNKRSEYQKLSSALVKARQEGIIPWEWVEDRVRQPRTVNMWRDLPDFMDTVRKAYRRDVWSTQPQYVEVWLEKDALSGIFSDITKEYGITLVVGRGYNSWSAFKDAEARFLRYNRPVSILYFGDFDPSGEDIVRALDESINFFGISPTIEKVALTMQDIRDYNLPPDFAKKTDSRAKVFIKQYGDVAVELDALPLPVLQAKIKDSIEANIDLDLLYAVQVVEKNERQQLADLIKKGA
ncbi:MAG: hypothetical protein ACYCX4_12970 [Bacillota bacterium]